jgi:hypothetical protein
MVSTKQELDYQIIEVMRLLGRIEYALTPYIWRLVCEPIGMTERTMYRQLDRLHNLGYVWRTRTSLYPRKRNTTIPGERIGEEQRSAITPISSPYVWGLTPEGKSYLDLEAVEPDEASLEGFKVRDRRAPNVPVQTLTHDLQAAWWSCGVIQEAMRCPLLHDVFVQVEYISLLKSQLKDEEGSGQRIDAVVGLRFDADREPTAIHPPGHIPWYDGFPSTPQMWWEWFALEVDRGTEPLKVLLGKSTVYRNMSVSNTYRRHFGGDLLPVFLAPTTRRAEQISQEWKAAWVDKNKNPLLSVKGVIATPHQAEHPRYGPLWGGYSLMADGNRKPSLLKNWTLEQWERMRR